MSYKPKMSEPIKLKEWYKDTGRRVKEVADELNITQTYLSQINTGRVAPGETLKETFRRLYPGYDVIEMRADYDVEEEAVEQESAAERKKQWPIYLRPTPRLIWPIALLKARTIITLGC